MTTKTKLGICGLIVAVILIAGLKANQAGLFKGQVVRMKILYASCPHQWTKVFEGEVRPESGRINTRWYEMAVTLPISFTQLENYVEQGCSVRVVKKSGAGGASGLEGLDCNVAGAFQGDGIFSCNTALISPTGNASDAAYFGARMSFAESPDMYYIPLDNEPDPVFLRLSIFVKK